MKEKRSLIENFISLMGVQFANYLLPLVSLPYLVRVLGVDNYGLMCFAFAFIQYFITLTDYGFQLSATKTISIHRNESEYVSDIFCSVMVVKTVLLLISVFVVLILCYFVARFKNDYIIYYISLISVFGNVLYLGWFYQGIEKTKYIAIYNLIAKIITTVAIFVFVNTKSDLYIAVLIQSGGVFLSGIISIGLLKRLYPIKYVCPSRTMIKQVINDGKAVFATVLSSTLVNNTNIFILGIFANNTKVGIFAVADKIIRLVVNLCNPISMTIFPRTSLLFATEKQNAIMFLRKVLKYGVIVFAALCIGMVIFSSFIIKYIAKTEAIKIHDLVMIMSVLPLSIFIDNIYGTQLLINIGKGREYFKSVFYPGILSVIISFIFVPRYYETASAIIVVVSELLILFIMMYYSRKNNIYLIKQGMV